MSLLQICPEKLKSIAELASEVISDRRAKTIMQLKNNGLVTWPQKGAKITLPRGPGLASSHRNFSRGMYHCSQLAIAIRGEQWLDTK